MCQRNLKWPVPLLVGGGAVLLFALLGLLLWGSGRLKTRVQRWEISVEDVRNATQSLVAGSPAVRNPIGFSGANETTVEHWDGRRWRVSGYVDTLSNTGVRVRILYFAVVVYSSKKWGLEDLQLQSMEVRRPPG
jgi:hypothetical protein